MRLSLSYPCYSNGIMRQLRNSIKHGNTGDNFLTTVLVFGLRFMQQRLTTMEPRGFRSEWEMCFLIQPPLTYLTVVAQHRKGDIHTNQVLQGGLGEVRSVSGFCNSTEFLISPLFFISVCLKHGYSFCSSTFCHACFVY